MPRPFVSADGEPVSGNHSVHGARARPHDPLYDDALVLENPVKRTPGEGAVRSASLQSKINRLATGAGIAIATIAHASAPGRIHAQYSRNLGIHAKDKLRTRIIAAIVKGEAKLSGWGANRTSEGLSDVRS